MEIILVKKERKHGVEEVFYFRWFGFTLKKFFLEIILVL